MSAEVDRPYRLAQELDPHHAEDVKSVLVIDDHLIASASRDQTVVLWSKNPSDQLFHIKSIFDGHKAYVNSLAYIPAREGADDFLASGGNSSLILLHSLSNPQPEAQACLFGHALNVCSLAYSPALRVLVSGSWDRTARVWSKKESDWSTDLVLEGHQEAVWDAVAIEQGTRRGCYLTGSADQLVILWSDQAEILLRIKGYPEPVRGLVTLPDGHAFASACNDGNIRISDFEGSVIGTLRGHTDSVFRVSLGVKGGIVSCSEDHSARIWDETGRQQGVLSHPCQTIWSASAFANGDILTGGSDGRVRIWTSAQDRMANKDRLFRFEAEVAKSLSASQSASIADGEGCDGSSDIVVIDVDVSDDSEPLKLSFRIVDDPSVVAEDFVRTHDLPHSYVERIQDFILQSAGKTPVIALETNERE